MERICLKISKRKLVLLIILPMFIASELIFSEQLEELCSQRSIENVALAKSLGYDLDTACGGSQKGTVQDKRIPISPPEEIDPRLTISSGLRTASNVVAPPGAGSLIPFGYDLFSGNPNTFAPTTNVPVSSDYILGPGDTFSILFFGKENRSFELEINREGFVDFPYLGPISVAGLTFKEAKTSFNKRIEMQLLGIEASISISKLKSIQVFVLGEAYKPGAYTLSSLSTISHALMASGGVSNIASLRNIKLMRKGKVVSVFDLYEMLIEGNNSEDVRLQSSDVVFIPTVNKYASIEGEVIRPAIYEIKEDTTVSDLLDLAGGTGPKAFLPSGKMYRIGKDGFMKVFDIDLSDIKNLERSLQAGDHFTVDSIANYTNNSVQLSGHLYHPGYFAWKSGMKVYDLLNDISQFPPKVDLDLAIISRKIGKGQKIKVIPINLGTILDDSSTNENIELLPLDEIIIFSTEESKSSQMLPILDSLSIQARYPDLPKTVRVSGPVRFPGDYPLVNGMRISNLIDFAGSLSVGYPEYDYALLQRESVNNGDQIIKFINLKELLNNPKSEENKILNPKDNLYVFTISEDKSARLSDLVTLLKSQARYKEEARVVSITGTVKFPGEYPLTEDMSIMDLVHAAGGLLEGSYTQNAEISRVFLSDSKSSIRLEVVNPFSSPDYRLKPYDSVNLKLLPEYSKRDEVEIFGEVIFPGKYLIQRGETLTSLIKRAGGFTNLAQINASIFTREELRERERKEIKRLRDKLLQELTYTEYKKNEDLSTPAIKAIQNKALLSLEEAQAVGRLVIPIQMIIGKREEDIVLKSGDRLYIPSTIQEVTILGEVFQPSSHLYSKRNSLKDYLEKAGGHTPLGDISSVYIVRSSGEVVRPNSGWLRRSNVRPGDTIVVPLNIYRSNKTFLRMLPIVAEASTIIYQLALGAAAIDQFNDD